MIQFRDFSFRYREGADLVVRDINLTIPDGCFVGITGAAGSGKSTLTYAVNGIIPHCYPGDFYGEVSVEGLDTMEASLTDLSQLVGSVCQDIDSQMVATVVEDELLYGLENFAVPREEIPGRVTEALAAMGIADVRDRTIDSLSGGQKQKVAVASVLALRPRVLVLDEPTAELDPASSVACWPATPASTAPRSSWWSRRSRCCPITPICSSSWTGAASASPTRPRPCSPTPIRCWPWA